MGVISILYICA